MFTHIVYVSVPIGIPIGRSFSILLLTWQMETKKC
jgi:hypothetical protein